MNSLSDNIKELSMTPNAMQVLVGLWIGIWSGVSGVF